MRKGIFVFGAMITLVVLLSQCEFSSTEPPIVEGEELAWLNHNDTVEYLGINTCKNCHAEIYNSFIQTGMGKSFGIANVQKSAMKGQSLHLIDSFSDFRYQTSFEGESLFLKEFKVNGKDTLHQLQEQVDYIIGSGQHTNSHLISRNGYVHQMPFTYYTQRGLLDLPPGFEGGYNTRFDRLIGLECMSCHNAMPVGFEMGSANKFNQVPLGIDCERCHGPGELHVNKIMSGNITDTSVEADPTIVNPKKLSAELQFEICQRCHLQGNAVLQPGKSFFDFKPGMHLKNVMDIYMPRPSSDNEQFIMAGHIQRFKMSNCFTESEGQFVCTSCHDPHISVQLTDPDRFNRNCWNCHGEKEAAECTEEISARNAVNDNCSSCHMPLKGSVDIPHVSVHDHYIRIPRQEKETEPSVEKGLYAVNNEKPSKLSRIKAYLQQFERFDKQPVLLDSASSLLEGDPKFAEERVHYLYLRNDLEGIVRYSRKNPQINEALGKTSFDNSSAWTAYRLAMAWKEASNDVFQTDLYFVKAIEAAPYILDFRAAYAGFLVSQGRLEEAEEQYQFSLKENDEHAESLNGLGYIYLNFGRFQEAEELFDRCLQLEPDHVLCRINRVLVHLQLENEKGLTRDLNYLKVYHADNQKVQQLINHLERGN